MDRGGTFTDVVVVDGDRLLVRKVRSDEACTGDLARGALTFGTTVATNALLERRGVPTLLLVSEGFEDLLAIGDMTRPDLFDPQAVWPDPLTQRVLAVPGRIDAKGTECSSLVLPQATVLSGVRAVAVALVNSHANPEHELALERWINGVAPDCYVALGHRHSPEVGYLHRIETTLVTACLTPVLQDAMTRDRIPSGARCIRSDGSLCPAPDLTAVDAVLSGPAGGVLAVAEVARRAGFGSAIGLDMGGTSTDVCRVAGDLPLRHEDTRVGGVRIRRPSLEVETIAAGGGSVLWSDGLRLGVGPQSAGADPGPQCYGRGGPATLTDAALQAGLIDPQAFDPPLRTEDVDLPGPCDAFLAVAREAMAAAVRRIATARGIDVRDDALVAYGGAAGQHAAAVAERLGIRTVLVHPCASVLSAWGQQLARREVEATRAVWRPLSDVVAELAPMAAAIQASLDALPDARWSVDLRLAGTDHCLAVPLMADDTEPMLVQRFTDAHRRRFGFAPEGAIEVVNVRVRLGEDTPPPPPAPSDVFGLGDRVVRGPRLLTCPTTAVWVPQGWSARGQEGILYLERVTLVERPDSEVRTPLGVALWGRRFMAVAEQAGETLRRLARSVNIRERLDFSCAVFDGAGQLVANAPHIPVHLGAMGVTVRDLIGSGARLDPGTAWLCNDPVAGGSHLPDLTVITPVYVDGERFFVGCRGHHVDVGGLTPGSMPPHSRTLAEEGFVVRHACILDGEGRRPLRPLLTGCRDPDTVIADLEAQIAANAHAARALGELGSGSQLRTWMGHLVDVGAECVEAWLETLTAGEAVDRIDGVEVRVALDPAPGALVVDFAGTEGPHPGNLNAPVGVVRAAVLYALRVMVAADIPLNEGVLRRVHLRVPPGSILDPPAGAAVVGGNVETSQRVVDLILRAAGFMAASAGTMCNLTLGGAGWAFYETLGGGSGATRSSAGVDGRQVHMTNTRATDPEVLEARLPLVVRHFGYRRGSGGRGAYRGGDGLVRVIEVLETADAAWLCARQDRGPEGAGSGGAGATAEAWIHDVDGRRRWDGLPVRVVASSLVELHSPGGGGYGPPALSEHPFRG